MGEQGTSAVRYIPGAVSRWLLLTLVLASHSAHAQEPSGRSQFVRIGATYGQDVLGSEDTRRGTVFSYGREWPEKRLAFARLPATLQVEAYYLFTRGGGFEDIPVNTMHSFGVLAQARYPFGFLRGVRSTVDLGWGIVYNSITTRDLDRNWNSTPTLGVTLERTPWMFSGRFYHISNGGTQGNNQGLNALQFLVGYRF